MRHAGMNAILILVALGSADPTRAQEPALKIPPELILERFQVNKGGDALLVPVKIAGKERMFLVDTGCPMTVVDVSLPLGEPQEAVTRDGVKIKYYRAPEASIGKLPLEIDFVTGSDLRPIREASGYPIEGVLGMDFLGQYVVHINFDRGHLLLLKSVPQDSGKLVPIRWSSGEYPEVEASSKSHQKMQCIIDSGCISHWSGSMKAGSQKESGDLQEVGSTLSETFSGTRTSRVFQGKQIRLDGFSVDTPIFGEHPRSNLLGLGFWSRFIVTFDFPNQKMYLKKGQEFARADLRDLSGLHLLKRDGGVVVHSVDKNRPGSLTGLRAGDVFLTFGPKRADEMSLFEIRKTLSTPGQLNCTIRRDSREGKLTLNLPR